MKIEDIKRGKKYYHRITTNVDDKLTGKRVKQWNELFVVEVDIPGNRVCASHNGFPAEWFRQSKFTRWKESKTDEITKCNCPRSFDKIANCKKNCNKNLKPKK